MNTFSQSIQGCITDQKGEPVIGATIFIREIAQGSVANEHGNFGLSVKPGSYTLEISSLGFKKQIRNIHIGSTPTVLNIQLEPTVYLLKEVRVGNNQEDPAYYIMRHAIARAPFHRNQIKSYFSEVYTKGTMQIDKIPGWLSVGNLSKATLRSLQGKLFLLESVMEIKFKSPDYYDRKVVAFSSTIPANLNPDDALNIVTASIYDPTVVGLISPLAPGAFSYYRFRFLECYTEGNLVINRIKVEPRKKSKQLIEGELYIAENLWSVVDFSFTAKMTGATARIKGRYHEVKPSVFLPTSYDIGVDVKLFGVKGNGKYYSSVKYKEVEATLLSNAIPAPSSGTMNKEVIKPTKQQKLESKIKELADKEELSNRESYRLANLTQQVIKEQRNDTTPPLELKPHRANDHVTVDTMAAKRDSLYWLQLRAIPLETNEITSYQIKDSIRQLVFENKKDSVKRNLGGIIISGGSVRLGENTRLSIDGLLRAVPEYNFVDGFWVGQRMKFNFRFSPKYNLHIQPAFYFATARRILIWNTEASFSYAPLSRGRLTVKSGHSSSDYKGDEGGWRLENSITSLVYANNFMKFYDNRFFYFQHEIDIMNGMVSTLGGSFEKRQIIENHISYNFFSKTAAPNTLESNGGQDMPDNTSTSFFAQINYTPRFHYRIEEGKKKYVYSNFPTFSVRYEQGISNKANRSSSYNRLDVGINQTIPGGIFNRFSYSVTAGKFLARKELYFPDYKHFNTAGWILNHDSFAEGYFLTDYYRLSTNDKWLNGAVNYRSAYLLLKRLPFLQDFLFDEAVHVRYLWTPVIKNYTEWGYSLGISDIGRLGVFISFDRKDYEGIGIRMSLPIKWK